MKLQVINIDGKKTENIELSDKIFSVKQNKNLIKSFHTPVNNTYLKVHRK